MSCQSHQLQKVALSRDHSGLQTPERGQRAEEQRETRQITMTCTVHFETYNIKCVGEIRYFIQSIHQQQDNSSLSLLPCLTPLLSVSEGVFSPSLVVITGMLLSPVPLPAQLAPVLDLVS